MGLFSGSRTQCRHGYEAGSEWVYTFSGASSRAVDEHERRCRGARFVAHPGFLFKIVCCLTCGTRVV